MKQFNEECKRIYVTPNGIGFGHVGRCIHITRRLTEKIPSKILFSTYLDGLKLLRREGFKVLEAPPLYFKTKPDGTVDVERTLLGPGLFAPLTVMEQIKIEMKYINMFKPDIVVSDSRATPIIAAKIMGIPSICILNQFQIIVPRERRFLRLSKLADAGILAIMGRVWTLSNSIIIPDFPPPYTISLMNLRTPKRYRKRMKFVGPILPVRPEELSKQEELKEKLGFNPEEPLIFAPISGPVKERAYIIGVLRQYFKDLPENYQIVMSLGYPNSPNRPLKNRRNLRLYWWIENRFEYLKACDLIVSRAGHETIIQSLCYGKPMVLLPTPSHTEQCNNAKRVKEFEAGEVLDQRYMTKEQFLKTVMKVLEEEEYKRKAEEISRFASKLNAIETIIEEIARLTSS